MLKIAFFHHQLISECYCKCIVAWSGYSQWTSCVFWSFETQWLCLFLSYFYFYFFFTSSCTAVTTSQLPKGHCFQKLSTVIKEIQISADLLYVICKQNSTLLYMVGESESRLCGWRSPKHARTHNSHWPWKKPFSGWLRLYLVICQGRSSWFKCQQQTNKPHSKPPLPVFAACAALDTPALSRWMAAVQVTDGEKLLSQEKGQ